MSILVVQDVVGRHLVDVMETPLGDTLDLDLAKILLFRGSHNTLRIVALEFNILS